MIELFVHDIIIYKEVVYLKYLEVEMDNENN